MAKYVPRLTMTQPLARLYSAMLWLIAAGCSSSSEPGAAGPVVLVVSGVPSPVTAGASVISTVTAKDASGNTVFGYAGTIHVTSTDTAAQLPSNYTFAAADRGSYTFTTTFPTAGPQTLTAIDVARSWLTGSETFTVTPKPAASDVFAVGEKGTILHFDGSSWRPQMSGTESMLFGVWGASGSDVFAVGRHGTVLHYDGTKWAVQPTPDTLDLYGVWGSSARDVFAVGNLGRILHFDGTNWTRQTRDTTFYLNGVWGSSGSNVYAAGSNGTILHYDGTGWTLKDCSYCGGGLPNELDGVWGISSSDVFAVGMGGGIVHYDGTRWTPQTSGTTAYLWSVWGSSRTK